METQTDTAAKPVSMAEYIAALLLYAARLSDGGLSAKIENVRSLPKEHFDLDVSAETVDEAIEILRRCDMAAVSEDRFAGQFVAIKRDALADFGRRVQSDLDDYDRIVRQAPDEHIGINRAEDQSYPYLELFNKFQPIKSLSRFGNPWMEEVLNRLRANDPVEAVTAGLPVNSTAWTGIQKRMHPAKLADIQQRISALRLAINQSELAERDKRNAISRVDAVERLLEAPDPPWKTIVSLLNDPILTAFLNVAAILTLIFS